MDNLFKIRTLTAAVNDIRTPETRIYDKFFRGKENLQMTDRLAFDIIYGNEGILGSISIYAQASMTDKTGRKTITMQAPRLAHARKILDAELNAMRQYGDQFATEQMTTRIAREQYDMKLMIDRTLEFWAANAMRGIIYDADLTTELVNYGVDSTHVIDLNDTSDEWDVSAGDPVANIRTWKRLIEEDSQTMITGWTAYVGYEAMDALLANETVLASMQYTKGSQLAESGRIAMLAGVQLEEYNGYYKNAAGTKKRTIGSNEFILIGECSDLTDCPYAPVINSEVAGGVGNTTGKGKGVMIAADTWVEKNPNGRMISLEARPLPVLKRPGAVVNAIVISD